MTNPRDYSQTYCDGRFVSIVRHLGSIEGVRVKGNLHDLIHPSLERDMQRIRGMMDSVAPLLELIDEREGTLQEINRKNGRVMLDRFTVAEVDELDYSRLFYDLREMGNRIRKHAQKMLDSSMVKIAQAAVIEAQGIDADEEDPDSCIVPRLAPLSADGEC